MNSEMKSFKSRLMDAKETAEFLKLDEKTISRWARNAYIPAHPLGEGRRKFWRFYEHELSAWISAQFNGADQSLNSSSTCPVQISVPEASDTHLECARPHIETRQNGLVVHNRSRRYQRGSLSILRNKKAPNAWTFRYYTNENGRRVYRRKVIGTVHDMPRRKDAEKAVAQLRLEINTEAGVRPMTVHELAVHFRSVELPLKAFSTRNVYENVLNGWVLPRWSQNSLLSIEATEVELWLRNLKTKAGRPASPATKCKVRNLMSSLFSHAIRYDWVTRNPIASVRTTSKRQREPDILEPSEFQALLKELPERERTMVLLAASTGLRRGELIGLRWSDVNFKEQLVNVIRSFWHNMEGDTKTLASRKPVPLQPAVIDALGRWRELSSYGAADDFLFPSLRGNGKHPLEPGMVLRNQIQPALHRIGVEKRIGWHSFRHGFSNLLRRNGVDLKTAQELLRHATSRVTLDFYQQSVTEERRRAQALAFKDLIGDVLG